MACRSRQPQSDLENARALYNDGQFDEVDRRGDGARRASQRSAPSATLIIARSRLERFRRLGDPQELAAARQELRSLNPRSLAPQEAIEWQIGLGTALFLEDQAGPAAEIFTAVIPSARARLTAAGVRKAPRVVGRAHCRGSPRASAGDARKEAYERMLSAVRVELERNPLSRPGHLLDGRCLAGRRRSRRRVECRRRRMDSSRYPAGRQAASQQISIGS